MNRYRVGADIGGTFTDIVFLGPDGVLHTKKLPSTVEDYGRGILEGVRSVLQANDLTAGDIDEILHATTVASNAILEAKGARAGLITTEGFRDVLEIRTLRMPRLYDLHWENRLRWCRAICAARCASASTTAARWKSPWMSRPRVRW